MRGGLGDQPTFIRFLVSSRRHKNCLLKNHILRLLNKIHPRVFQMHHYLFLVIFQPHLLTLFSLVFHPFNL